MLKAGKTRSCGCLAAEVKRSAKSHGMVGTRTYAIWCGMISRCRRANGNRAHLYALKGIQVCERWQDFSNFLADMGEAGEHNSIDRLDANRNYEPGNCRWATSRQQRQNTGDALHVTHDGQTKALVQWAEDLGLKYHTVYARFKRGLPLDRVFAQADLRL